MPASPPRPPLIVADIGATNARFGVIEALDAPISRVSHFGDASFASFEDCVTAYLAELGGAAPRAFAAGAAGPLKAGVIKLTNRDWTVDPDRLRARFGLTTLALTNDLVAMAAGIALAPNESFLDLSGTKGVKPRRSLVIAVGTGLGVAWFERAGETVRLHPSEAGHMVMAPANESEAQLLTTLLTARAPVYFESVISGSGMPHIYAALRGESAPKLETTEAIVDAAETDSNAIARTVLDLALGAIATFARDLVHALGGVDEIVFAGGLGLRLKRHLSTPAFLRRLRDSKGIPLDLTQVSVRLALDDSLPLRGAAHLAFGRVECTQLFRNE